MVSIPKKIVIGAALLGIAAFFALHRLRDVRAHAGEWTDGTTFSKSVSTPAVRHATWGPPVELGGSLNTKGDETRAARSPDGRFVVFAAGSRGLDADLWIADLVGSTPGPARPLATQNTSSDEIAPAFGRDGLYFASNRPGGAGGLDLWRAPFVKAVRGAGWVGPETSPADGQNCDSLGPPERLAGAINSGADDTDPACSFTTDEILFASNRGGDFDLYAAVEAASGFDVTRLDSLASESDEREPTMDHDGRIALFASNRAGAWGFDIFCTARSHSGWTAPTSVSAFNTPDDDRGPLLLGNGFEAWFVRRGSTHSLDLWRARALELVRVPEHGWSWTEIVSIASLLALAILAFLAGRWPRFETIYKCFLVSVIVHLLLLWWLQWVHLEGGAAPGGTKGDRIRVHLRDDGTGIASARSERNGRLAPLPSSTSRGPDLERAELTDAEITESTPSGPRLAELRPAAAGEVPAPLRAAGVSLPSPDVSALASRVSDSEAQPARATVVARELALRPLVFEASTDAPSSESLRRLASRAVAPAPLATGPSGPGNAIDVQGRLALEEPRSKRSSLAPSDHEGGDPRIVGLADDEASRVLESTRKSTETNTRAFEDSIVSAILPVDSVVPAETSAPERARFETRLAETVSPPASLPISAAASKAAPDSPVERPKWEGTPYKNREGLAKDRALRDHGGTVETERAVERGLAYLARVQDPRGFFGPIDTVDDKYGRIAVGKTALCALAFLGAGHTHVSGTKYSPNVQRALAFLLAMQDEASGHFGDSDAYSHGIATYALAEAFALTKDATLRASLEPAVKHILAKQSKNADPRLFGGWGYYYSDERTFDRWSRTSITAWQVMALESARLSGIGVPDGAFVDAARFLDAARDEEGEWYRYNHDPTRLNSSYPTLPASTPAALFALSITGRDIGTREFDGARTYVLTRAPRSFAFTSEDDFVNRGQGNLYFWYYGTLAMFRTDGGAWATWNAAMKSVLLPAQQRDGSWKPIDVYARYARDDDRDRSYTTALCVLSLEVYYRYFLPLLKAR